MSGIINKSKSVDSTNNAFSPVPNKDSFPWKRVENNKDVPIPPPSNEEKASLPRIDKKKETLYSAYDSFLDDKRNTYLSESTFTFDTFNRTPYNDDSEYEPIVENQMAIITNEQPKPQRYSMLSSLAPIKHVSLEKPAIAMASHTYEYTEDDDENDAIDAYQDYSYVSYESDNDSAPPLQNQLNNENESSKNVDRKVIEKKIEERIESYKNNLYLSSSDSESMEDYSLEFHGKTGRDSKEDIVDNVAKKLKKDDNTNEVKVDSDKKMEKSDNDKAPKEKKEDAHKSQGQLEREKAAREAEEIAALKPSYVGQIQIKPVVNEITPQMMVDAEKDATKDADDSLANLKPQYVENVTIQPNVVSINESMIKQPSHSIYISSKELENMNENSDVEDSQDLSRGKGKTGSESDDEFYKTREGLKNMSIDEINKNELTKEKEDSETSSMDHDDPRRLDSVVDIKKVDSEDKPKTELKTENMNVPKKQPKMESTKTHHIQSSRSVRQQSFLEDNERENKVLEHPNPLIYSGYLEKLSTHGRFQKRLFRFDGLIFTCLTQNKQKIPHNSNLLKFQPLFVKDGTEESYQFVESIGTFYPSNPVSPEIINPLVAVEKSNSSAGVPDLKSRQYYYPKWMLNIHEIESIQPLLNIQNYAGDRNDINEILRTNKPMQNELTFIINTRKISYILRAPNDRDFNRWMYMLNRMKETYIELQEETFNPYPTVPRPKFKAFPPPPDSPPPPELLAHRFRDVQDYALTVFGFPLVVPEYLLMEANKALIVQICKDIRDPYFRRIALLKVWNICFTDLLCIDNNVSNNAVIIPVNKAIMAKEGPKLPQLPANQAVNFGLPNGMGVGVPNNLMNIKSGTRNQMGIPIATPALNSPMVGPQGMISPMMGPQGIISPRIGPQGMISPKMQGMISPRVGPVVLSPQVGPQVVVSPKVGPVVLSPQVGPQVVVSPKVGPVVLSPQIGPQVVVSPKVGPVVLSPQIGPQVVVSPKMMALQGIDPQAMIPGIGSPRNGPVMAPGIGSPRAGPVMAGIGSPRAGPVMAGIGSPRAGPVMAPGIGSPHAGAIDAGMISPRIAIQDLKSPRAGPVGMGLPSIMLNNNNSVSTLNRNGTRPEDISLLNDSMHLPPNAMINNSMINNSMINNSMINNSMINNSMSIDPNIKELMNYGNKEENGNEDDDRFFLPKNEDGSLNPFIGNNSVIGKTDSSLHYKKLSLMDVGGNFNNLYKALGNENGSTTPKKASKLASTDHFAQELELLDSMNNSMSMNKNGFDPRQVSMTNILSGLSKNNIPDDSIMTEDISVSFNQNSLSRVIFEASHSNNNNNTLTRNNYDPTQNILNKSLFEGSQNSLKRNYFDDGTLDRTSTLDRLHSTIDRKPDGTLDRTKGEGTLDRTKTNGSPKKIEIPIDPELLHCLTAMLRIIHRLSGSCFREEQKSSESIPPPVPKWYYQFCVKSFPSFARLSQNHVINYLECMEEEYSANGYQELPDQYYRIKVALDSFIEATRAWERVVNDWKRDIIHRKQINHKRISFDDDDSIMKVVRINDVLRVNLLLKDHIEENARRETSKLRKLFQPPQPKKTK